MRIHVEPQLGNLARIKTDLIDDELRAALDLLFELLVLRNHFAFAQFKIGGDRADAKLRFQQLLFLNQFSSVYGRM